MHSGVYAPKIPHPTRQKTWREKFFVPVREEKKSRAGTKKISSHFSRFYEP
nr:DUF1661 domain-containing protein [Porphyromonas gulae]